MKCAEIMTMNPQMCVPEDEVAVAINFMWDYDCGAIPVVMDSESKKLVGIVTDRDIAMHVVKHACLHPSQAKVSDCMVSSIITCQPEDSVEMAIKLMNEYQVRRIPIVDENGSCMGIISEADLLLRAISVKSEYMEPVLAALQQISIPCSNVNLVESVEPIADIAKDKALAATKIK
jgi:CBS domain-containing protein